MDNDYRSSNTRRTSIDSVTVDRRVHTKRAVEVEESATTEAAVVASLSTGDVGRLRAICIAEAETAHPYLWRRVSGRWRSDGVANQLLSITAGEWLVGKRPPLGNP